MYNEQRKQRFLSDSYQKDETVKLISGMFRKIEQFEADYQKDFSTFSTDQLDSCIPAVSGVRVGTGGVAISYLRSYVRWCSQNGYETSDDIFSYELDLSRKARERYVKSPDHLLYVLDYVFCNLDNNEIEYIYRTYLWLAYFGFIESDAAAVCEDDVDLGKMEISDPFGGSKKQIYNQAMHDIYMACTLRQFRETKNATVIVPRMVGRETLRGKMSTRASSKSVRQSVPTTFRQIVSKRFADASRRYAESGKTDYYLESLSLSYKRIYLSGVFFRAKQHEDLTGDCPTFDFAHDNRRKEIAAYQEKGYAEDYENWKRAFPKNTLEV